MCAQASMPKTKLVATAANLVYHQGWNATGINQILNEAKVPKGSFYYYFQSKEDLGVAIIQYHAEQYELIYSATMLNPQLSGRDGLTKYFLDAAERFKQEGLRWGCPVGTFSNEVADTTEKIADACREFMTRFFEVVSLAIKRGQADGSIKTTANPITVALQISSVWQGTLLNMKTLHAVDPLQAGVDLIASLLNR